MPVQFRTCIAEAHSSTRRSPTPRADAGQSTEFQQDRRSKVRLGAERNGRSEDGVGCRQPVKVQDSQYAPIDWSQPSTSRMPPSTVAARFPKQLMLQRRPLVCLLCSLTIGTDNLYLVVGQRQVLLDQHDSILEDVFEAVLDFLTPSSINS
jgi:hypothetical protein